LRTLGALFILAAAVLSPALTFAADPFPASGAAKLAAYSVCRAAVILDMGAAIGSNSSAECTGIVKTRDGSKLLDNLAIRCMEESKARPEGYAFTGTCIQTDGDGDKIFMTYQGPEAATSRSSAGPASIKRSPAPEPGASPTRRATRRNCSRSRLRTM